MQSSTPLWTVAFTEPGSDDVAVAVIGACNREDAERRALDVLGVGVALVWVEPRHEAPVAA
ncbi:hypothetical protein [Curtobacterium sp. RRHDQ10]|uniref:hypothetical protein n=1 Tax=Curtobacterium phyllosphaerae TaxID=3413379 RepID=UPI003BEF8500